MVDNVTLNTGTGGDVIATEDISGVEYQKVKLIDGTATSTTVIEGGGGTEAGALRVTVANDSTGVLSVDDNGGSLTVDGTVTANLSATDNAVLDQIDSNTDFGAVTGGGAEASALRVTLANDSTGVVSVDDNGGSLTVDGTVTANLSATDNAVLDNIDTNTTGLNNTVGTDGAAGPSSALSMAGTESGGTLQELRVDTDGHLQVDVLSGGGSGTEYTQDDAVTDPATASTFLMARDDALATQETADNDWTVPRSNERGAQWVALDQNGTDVTIADGGNSITVDGTVTANLSATDNAVLDSIDSAVNGTLTVDLSTNNDVTIDGSSVVFTDDTSTHTAATTQVLGIGAVAAPTDTTVNANDIAMPAMSTDRRLHTDTQIVGQDADITIADGGNSITVDGTVTANAGTGTFTVDLGTNNDVTIDGSSVVFVDDTATHTAATTEVLGIGAVAAPTDTTVDANDIAMPGMSTDRRMWTDTQIVGQDANLTVDLGATDNAVLDQIEVNTSYGDNVGNGTAAGSLRVTVASDTTGVLSVDDNGGSLTVDGTVTANLSATDNAVLDNIDSNTSATQTAVEVIDNAIHVDDAGFTLGTDSGVMIMGFAGTQSVNANDAAALACDTDGALHISDGGNTITVDGTITADAGTGTFTVTDDGSFTLAANSGVDIGDVDILSVTPGTGASNLGKAEDDPHTTGDVGVMALAVRQDTQTDFGADGDYVPLSIDANGAVRVTGGGGGTEYTEDAVAAADPVGGAQILVREDAPVSIAADGDNVARRGTQYGAAYTQIVDSSGNFIDTFGGSGGTAAADDADFTAGTTQGTPAMGVYESSPTSVTDGDLGTVGITSTRSLKVEETNSGAILADTANMDTNLGTVAGAVSGTEMQVDVVAALPAGDNNIGNVDIASSVALDVSAATVTVDLGTNNDVTIDGSSTVFTDDTSTHTAATTQVLGIGAVAAPTDTTVDANDIAMPAMSTDRRLHTDAQIVGQDADITIADGGNSITVDGTVTANLSATDNAVLDNIDADTSAIQTAVEIIDNAVHVDDAAFTLGTDSGVMMMGFAGTQSVDANDAAVLACDTDGHLQVDVLSGGGSGTEYTQDDAATDPATAGTTLMVRDDALSTQETADGDWTVPRTNARGAQWVELDLTNDVTIADGGNSITVDGTVTADAGTGTFTVTDDGSFTLAANSGVDIGDVDVISVTPGTAAGNLGKAEDVAHTTGDTGVAALAVRRDTAASGVNADGDYATLNVNSSGRLYTSTTVDAALPTGSNTIGNIGTIATSVTPGVAAANLGKAEDAVHASGDTGVMALTRRIDAVASSAGTSGDYATLNTDANGRLYTTAQVAGAVAHDAVNSGNPILTGARATNSIEGVTQVANADRTYLQADLNGVLLQRPHTTLEEILSERVSDTGGTSTNFTTFGAGGAGVHNYVTTISIYNSSATDGYVDFRDGSAGSIIFTAAAPAAGGSVVTFPVPLKGAANTALAYDVSGALSTVYISVVGFQAQG